MRLYRISSNHIRLIANFPADATLSIKTVFVTFCYSWLVVLGLTALRDSISVYIGPSPREREKETRKDRREKKCPNNPPAPTASAVGPCPTFIQISRTPRHWKFTQHHRTTRPPPFVIVVVSVVECRNNALLVGLSVCTSSFSSC